MFHEPDVLMITSQVSAGIYIRGDIEDLVIFDDGNLFLNGFVFQLPSTAVFHTFNVGNLLAHIWLNACKLFDEFSLLLGDL